MTLLAFSETLTYALLVWAAGTTAISASVWFAFAPVKADAREVRRDG